MARSCPASKDGRHARPTKCNCDPASGHKSDTCPIHGVRDRQRCAHCGQNVRWRYATDLERFDAKWRAREETGCHEWVDQTGTNGYGNFHLGGKTMAAHRVAWMLKRGAVPKGMLVCHTCDNPVCVNPDHMFLGTPLDNTRDMFAKGRARKTGSYRARMLVSDGQVREIRNRAAAGELQIALAREFGVSFGHISAIVLRKVRKNA